MGEALDEGAAEAVTFDADDEAGAVGEGGGDPGCKGLEADGVEIGVDAAVAVEQEIAQEIGAEDGVLER